MHAKGKNIEEQPQLPLEGPTEEEYERWKHEQEEEERKKKDDDRRGVVIVEPPSDASGGYGTVIPMC